MQLPPQPEHTLILTLVLHASQPCVQDFLPCSRMAAALASTAAYSQPVHP